MKPVCSVTIGLLEDGRVCVNGTIPSKMHARYMLGEALDAILTRFNEAAAKAEDPGILVAHGSLPMNGR